MRVSLLVLLLLATGMTHGHEVRHVTIEAPALVTTIRYADDVNVAGAPYEIRPRGQVDPIQMGWTDSQGRIAFASAAPGAYQVSVFTMDGHGVNFELVVDETQTLAAADRPLVERHAGIVAGVGILFGLFGLLMLFQRRSAG